MVYAYWCQTIHGEKFNMMSDDLMVPGTKILHKGKEAVIVDIAEESSITPSEMYEVLQAEREGWC